jgi:uncharacterized membrane protein YfcA
VVLVAAFSAGLIDAMVGGGGPIQIPALFAVYPNVSPPALLGTNKFAGIFGHIQHGGVLRAESCHPVARAIAAHACRTRERLRVVNLAGSAAALSYFAFSGLVLWYVGAAMAACCDFHAVGTQ